MKFRPDLVKKLKPEMLLEGIVANTHRYKSEPLLSNTGVGSLSTATTEERAKEDALSTDIIERLMSESKSSGKKRGRAS